MKRSLCAGTRSVLKLGWSFLHFGMILPKSARTLWLYPVFCKPSINTNPPFEGQYYTHGRNPMALTSHRPKLRSAIPRKYRLSLVPRPSCPLPHRTPFRIDCRKGFPTFQRTRVSEPNRCHLTSEKPSTLLPDITGLANASTMKRTFKLTRSPVACKIPKLAGPRAARALNARHPVRQGISAKVLRPRHQPWPLSSRRGPLTPDYSNANRVSVPPNLSICLDRSTACAGSLAKCICHLLSDFLTRNIMSLTK